MTIRADTSRVLMSDVLNDAVIEGVTVDAPSYIICRINVKDDEEKSIVGTLSSILLDEHIEVEVSTLLEDGFTTLKNFTLYKIASLEISGDENGGMSIEGPLTISAVRIEAIDYTRRMCTLLVKLQGELPIYMRG